MGQGSTVPGNLGGTLRKVPDEEVGGIEPARTIRFRLESGVYVADEGALLDWVIEQVGKLPKFRYVGGWERVETGGDPEDSADVVTLDGGDIVFRLDDPVSILQLVAALLIDSIPGLVQESSDWEVDWE